MLHENTVLILGAGASYDYGFPTGDGLAQAIHQTLTVDYRDKGIVLEGLGFNHDELYEFQNRISELELPTLDTFIVDHHPNYTRMAKGAIAAALIPFEKNEAISKPAPPRKHWYRFLFQQMIGDHRDHFKVSASRLGIITFNYDRSLEYYLFDALKKSYDEKHALECFRQLRITHVYGSLGKLDFIYPQDANSRPFNPSVTKEAIEKCMNTITMVSEAHAPRDLDYALHDPFLDVIKVCFLGFGYAPQNIRRLIYSRDALVGKEVYGTSYHLPATRRKEAAEQIEGIVLGDWDEDVLDFLEKKQIL